MRSYQILLHAKNEGLSYEDASGIYHFDISLESKTWTVHLPPSKGMEFVRHDLSLQEQELLFPRIKKYLSRIWWLGVWPVDYTVTFHDSSREKAETVLRKVRKVQPLAGDERLNKA
jgi:hypothetical protein